jgi:hypothetical protein
MWLDISLQKVDSDIAGIDYEFLLRILH